MSRPVKVAIKHVAHSMYHNLSNGRKRKRAIDKFADKIGLVHFGSVNQHRDDHRVVRGFSVSSYHQDSSYAVGSVGEYNINLVDRSDAVMQTDGSIAMYRWLIMAFDLHTDYDIPHFFIHANNRDMNSYKTFFTVFPMMKPVEMGTLEQYGDEFISRFTVFSRPFSSIQVEQLITADIAKVLGAHFWPFSAEIHEKVLYIYSDDKNVSNSLLRAMLESGLWLAGQIDKQAEKI